VVVNELYIVNTRQISSLPEFFENQSISGYVHEKEPRYFNFCFNL